MRRIARHHIDGYLLMLVAVLSAIVATRLQSYLLFHAMAEMAWIAISLTAFSLAWNTQKNLDNPVLLTIGVSLGPLAVMRLLHLLSFKGMGVFLGYDANLPTQLWVAERCIEAGAAFCAVVVAPARIRPRTTLAVTTLLAVVTVTLIFIGRFPDCFVEGVGLTRFKVVSEYAVMAVLALTLLRLQALRRLFPGRVLPLIQWAMALAIAEEACFTLYTDVYGISNMAGHVLQTVYAGLVYVGIIRFGLTEPQQALYHQLTVLNGRLAEEAVASNERAALAVEAAGGAAWEWDMVSRQPKLTQRHSDWCGRDGGDGWRDSIFEADRASFDALLQARDCDEGRSAEYRVRLSDGSVGWFATTTRVFQRNSGLVMIGLDQDISDHKAMESERAALQGDVQRFAEALAHHLQEPARLQGCYAQILGRRLPPPLQPDVAEALNVVQTEANRLRQLLRDAHLYLVLDRLPSSLAVSDCDAALAKAWEKLADRAAESHAVLRSDPLPSLRMPEKRIEELFGILLDNAIEYRHADRAPVIHVGAEQVDGEHLIHVTDNGIGIEPDYHERIFLAFERLHPADRHPGTGIGLALARKIVDSAGGRIWVTSAAGEGASFHIALPMG